MSVRTKELVSEPAIDGVKLRLRLQAVPGARAVAVQSAGVPLPLTRVKFAPTVSELMVKDALPLLETVRDCGLSELVKPVWVGAKVKDGGWERWNSMMPTPLEKPIKALPLLSSATQVGS